MDIVAESLSANVLKARNVTVRGQDVLKWFESKLSASVSFAGVFDDLSLAPIRNGAVAIVGSKDYIYSSTTSAWQEFGDEGQIGTLTQAVRALSDELSGYATSSDLDALAAAVVWLKKNKVQTLKLNDNSVETSADGGVAKLDDFFTESNSLLTGTIDDRLPIPISAKSAGFTTESYKRFIVTVSGDMTVILHTPTSEDAEIFECRFNGASLSADASITFAGATATTMDANCGTVTAGKVALMSAFWNGSTWDVNWKVEG